MNAFLAAAVLLIASSSAAPGEQGAIKRLSLYCWTEYVPQAVIDAFSAETGITVTVESFSSNDELLRRRLENGRFDLIQPSDYAAERLIRFHALEPLDRSRIPNLANLDPAFTGLRHDPAGAFTVPWLAGTVGIVVNKDRVKEPLKRIGDVFSGNYHGRIVALNDPREWVTWGLAHLGIPINEVTPDTLARVRPVLAAWLPQVAVFDSDAPHEALLDGRADVGIVWSGEAALLLAERRDFEYVLPAEGAHRFVDCLAIPRGAANKAHAEAFIDYILRPEVSARISEEFPYTNPNAEAVKRLPAGSRENPASYPAAGVALESLGDIGDLAPEVEKLFNELRWQRGDE